MNEYQSCFSDRPASCVISPLFNSRTPFVRRSVIYSLVKCFGCHAMHLSQPIFLYLNSSIIFQAELPLVFDEMLEDSSRLLNLIKIPDSNRIVISEHSNVLGVTISPSYHRKAFDFH